MRIVSLLPSATEIVYALGLGDQLVGRTHECDYPVDVADVPTVTADVAPGSAAEVSSRRIHDRVAEAIHGGSSLYRLDTELLADLRPDLVLTQELCDVCAVSYREVNAAVRAIGGDITVVSLEPHTIEGILNTVATVGAFAEAEDEAVGLVELLRERLLGLEQRVLERRAEGVASRRAVVLEWLDPPFASGHWVPEMVRRAGGWELLGREGERSLQTSWGQVREVEPEVMVLALCGFDAVRASRELEDAALPAWFNQLEAVSDGQLFAVDGSGLFSRPGPRVIDGVALLAQLFDPEGFADATPSDAWIPLGPVGIGSRD
jgi:iron complex transport system substrate-binding protein